MGSHYDPAKSCRVGTMDEPQFYAEAGAENGTYFRSLIDTWTGAGGSLKWGAGGVSLRGKVGGSEIAICFAAPQFGGKQDRIELACATLTKQAGSEWVASLNDSLRAAAGEQVLGQSMISIVQPGKLPLHRQQALTTAFVSALD